MSDLVDKIGLFPYQPCYIVMPHRRHFLFHSIV